MEEPLEPNDAVGRRCKVVMDATVLLWRPSPTEGTVKAFDVTLSHVPKPAEDMGGRSKLVHGVEELQRILGSILRVPPPKTPSTQIRLDRDRKVSLTKSST
ncbi:hypothetical protein FS837_007744, partial [Tulasnella sp. UAMH 9824]